jgi:hypothetical protein
MTLVEPEVTPVGSSSVATRGENGTDYFRPTDRPKAYGRQKTDSVG